MFPSWWRSLVNLTNENGKQTRRGRKSRSRRRQSYRPEVERFEDRLVPTTLSIPTNLTGARGGVVSVPIKVDTLGSGLDGGNFVIYYDQSVLSVTVSNVSLGTVPGAFSPSAPNGWEVSQVNTATPGQLLIGIAATTAYTGTNGGTLVNVNFHVSGTIPYGATTMVDLAADTNLTGTPYVPTRISTSSGSVYYTLTAPPMDNATSLSPYVYSGSDPDDGLMSITGTVTMASRWPSTTATPSR